MDTRRNGNQERLIPRVLPFLRWRERFSRASLRADLVSGVTVALVLIPQSMAYAQLAGLPAYYGLYAAFVPPIVAALFGSSAQLATGPVAVVSLMTATALQPLATTGSAAFIMYALALALIVGLFQLLLGAFRLGMVVNLLSHPVVNGFTNAAALIIASSQLSKLFGVSVEAGKHQYETVWSVCRAAAHFIHWPTLGMAVLAFAVMVGLRRVNPRIPNVLVAVVLTTTLSWLIGFRHDQRADLGAIRDPVVRKTVRDLGDALAGAGNLQEQHRQALAALRQATSQAGAGSLKALELRHQAALLELQAREQAERASTLRRMLRSTVFVAVVGGDGGLAFYPQGHAPAGATRDGRRWRLELGNGKFDPQRLTFAGGGAVVGEIPRGIPSPRMPHLKAGAVLTLLPMAVIISILGFMEAISIAKAMAARTHQRVDPNQELIGQGLANVVGAFFQSYPVSGSFSRSAVNLQAGAETGLSSVFGSVVVLITLLFLTPLLFHLPQSVLAAIIMVAVIGLVDLKAILHSWRAQRHDGLISIVTFVTTLVAAPHLEKGIFLGITLTLGLYLFRTMKPKVALLSRYTDGSYRNAERWGLDLCRRVAVIRFNGSLFFSNVSYLEEQILERVSAMPELRHVLIVGNGINEIDSSGEEMLSRMVGRLREAGYDVSLSGLNDSVIDLLRRTKLYWVIGEDHFYRSVAAALPILYERTHDAGDEQECPLLTPCFRGLAVSADVHRRAEILEGPRRE
ncbi:MAG: STAS domain-containing protein [Acidobacteria bacterium]|nr:STAS domain-containing protein [Acidobacteriota bacterium]